MPQKNKKTTRQPREAKALSDPWISMRSGMIAMGVVSIGITLWTIYQAYAQEGKLTGETLLLGVFFGLSTWLVFFGFILFNRFLRRGR